MHGKSILLIIAGGIAAYKSLELIRRLKERGARVRCIVTASGQQFVTPLSVAALSEEPVFTDLFDLKNETEIGHIRLSREADLIIIAPATADLLAKMTHGLCDDLASTVILAGDKPVLAAPAMNWRMWEHPATKRNMAQLKADDVFFVGPNEGGMACGEYGVGRMAEVDEIIQAADAILNEAADRPLAGKHVLITAGPTFEPLDPVRFIGNRSSGKQGYAVAIAAAKFGARVTLLAGPGALPDPPGMTVVHVETAQAMLDATEAALPADIAVFAAAVADWRAAHVETEKMKKGAASPHLALVQNPDILQLISHRKVDRPALVIGFAAETENVVMHAARKLETKGCDWIVANDVSEGHGTFGGDKNAVHLITASRVQNWPEMSKDAVAERLMLEAATFLENNRSDHHSHETVYSDDSNE